MERDPRIDPQPGDQIKQNSGIVLEVTYRVMRGYTEWVGWRRIFKTPQPNAENAWTLKAWREIVAHKAAVTHVSAEPKP